MYTERNKWTRRLVRRMTSQQQLIDFSAMTMKLARMQGAELAEDGGSSSISCGLGQTSTNSSRGVAAQVGTLPESQHHGGRRRIRASVRSQPQIFQVAGGNEAAEMAISSNIHRQRAQCLVSASSFSCHEIGNVTLRQSV